MVTVVSLLLPPVITRNPPVADRAAARKIVLANHPAVIEGVWVIAPTALATFSRAEITARSTALRDIRQFRIQRRLRSFLLWRMIILRPRRRFMFDARCHRHFSCMLRRFVRRFERLGPAPPPAGKWQIVDALRWHASGWMLGTEPLDIGIMPRRAGRGAVRGGTIEQVTQILNARRALVSRAPSPRIRFLRDRWPLFHVPLAWRHRANLILIKRSWRSP